MRYLTYFKYFLRHKWFVFWACRKMRVPIWIGIFHDWDKFLPEMVIAYSNYFYDDKGKDNQIRDKGGYFNPTISGDVRFDLARFMHMKRNKHHWQYWTMIDHNKTDITMNMPEVYIREMIADWIGAHAAQKSTGSVAEWYYRHKDSIILSYDTRKRVESLLTGFML